MECENGVCKLNKEKSTTDTLEIPLHLPTDTNKEWLVYGRENCSYCTKTIENLKSKPDSYEYVDIDKHGGGNKVKQKLSEWIGDYSTVPLIFHDKKFIGGYAEMIQIQNKIQNKS